MGCAGAVTLALVSVLSGCRHVSDAASESSAAKPPARETGEEASVKSKLARVGLELISEREAGLPESELGRYIPCRVLAGASSSPLAADPAGYLIVGFDGEEAGDAGKILAVFERWRVGETLFLRVRRNPYLAVEPGWWEVHTLPVTLR